ncbi:MAG TPA: hypothetical protein VER03_02205 [Bryobacteraceae bacterium]|nr:hypothetical protein [Bryobacteraceae bacterium]
MIQIRLTAAIAIALFVRANTAPRPAVELLQAGEFHGDEVRARNGEIRLAFDGIAWARAKLRTGVGRRSF